MDRLLTIQSGVAGLPWLKHLHAQYRNYRTAPLSKWEHSLVHDLLVYSTWFAITLSVLFAIALYAVWGYVPNIWIALFLISFTLEAVVKTAIGRRFKSISRVEQSSPAWRFIFDAGVAYASISYGLAFLAMFYPLPHENRLLLIAVYCALVCGLIALTPFYRTIALSSTPMLLIPTFAALVLSGKSQLLLLAFVMFTTTVVTLRLSRIAQGRFRKVFELNEKNGELVDELRSQRTRAVQLQAKAEQAVVDKNQFVAVASHDLRQPLHALGLFHHTLRLNSETAANRAIFDSLDRSTTALNTMFDSLLDVSRLEANGIEPELELIALSSVLELLEQEFSPVATEKSLYLHFTAPNVQLHTDPTLLTRILRNLINNAIKFTHEGGVSVHTRVEGNYLICTITDTGPGIPLHEQNNVFSEFYQLDAEQRRGASGVGLGLSIVRQLCALLDMDISLTTADGGGTRALLTMKCVHTEQLAQQHTKKGASLATSSGRLPSRSPVQTSTFINSAPDLNANKLNGMSLLVIDDDDDIRLGMQTMLSGDDWSIICAADATEAIAKMNALGGPPDFVVCDFQLAQGRFGTDAIKHLSEHFGVKLPAILTSGASSPVDLMKIKRSGFSCLIKPVAPEHLRLAIVSTMQSHAHV